MSRILITGGTGFIGSCFIKYLLERKSATAKVPESQSKVEALEQAKAVSTESAKLDLDTCEIFCLARQPFNTEYLAEVQNQVHWCAYDGTYESVVAAIEQSKPDIVYHLATFFSKGHSAIELGKMLSANVEFGAQLLEAMTQQGCKRLIYTTSITEYGPEGEYAPITLYAATKRALLDIAEYYVKEGLLRMGMLVLTDTYGQLDKRPKVMNTVKQTALKQQSMQFNSTGEQVFDLIYIDDALEALYLLGQRFLDDEGEALQRYQVYADKPLSLKETVELFKQVNNLELQVSWKDRVDQSTVQSKAVRVYPRVPNWQEKVPLAEGLKRFYQG